MEEITVNVCELTNEEIFKHIEILKEQSKSYREKIKKFRQEKNGDEALLLELKRLDLKNTVEMLKQELVKRKVKF